MARNTAHFGVSPRLAVLLGESYRTAELALKELVDNAWDANALTVNIQIPPAMTQNAEIVISDAGEGMSPKQIKEQYLRIARNRLKDRGTRTAPPLNREVKGRKGVGKFAGIIIAEVMDVATRQNGKLSRFRIDRRTLEETPGDIVRIKVPIETVKCGAGESGTTIRLSHLAQSMNFPTADSLRHALAPDYTRCRRHPRPDRARGWPRARAGNQDRNGPAVGRAEDHRRALPPRRLLLRGGAFCRRWRCID